MLASDPQGLIDAALEGQPEAVLRLSKELIGRGRPDVASMLRQATGVTGGRLPTPRTALDAMAETGVKPIPVLGAIVDAWGSGKLWAASRRLEDGRGTAEDEKLTLGFLEDERRKEAKGETTGYVAMRILTELPAFLGEFAATGGLYTAGKVAARKAARTAAGKAVRQSIERVAGRTAASLAVRASGAVAGASLQAAANVPRVVGATLQRAMPTWATTEDEAGEAALTLVESGRSFMSALPAGYADTLIEYVSERAGAGIAQVPGISRLVALQGRVLEKIAGGSKGKLGELLKQVGSASGWHGVIAEMGEERFASVLRAAVLDDPWEDVFPSGRQLAGEAIAFSVPGVAGAAARRVAGKAGAAVEAGEGDPVPVEADETAPATSQEGADAAPAGIPEAPVGQPSQESLAPAAPSPSRARLLEVFQERNQGAMGKKLGLKVVEPTEPAEVWASEAARAFGNELVLVDAGEKLDLPASQAARTIVLDRNVGPEEKVKRVIFHELIHSLQTELPELSRETFGKVEEIAPGVLEKAAGAYESIWNRLNKLDPVGAAEVEAGKLADWAAQTGQALTPDQRRKEGEAFFVENVAGYLDEALTNPERLEALTATPEGRTFLQKILDALRRMVGRLTGRQMPSLQADLAALKDEIARSPLEKSLDPQVAARIALTLRAGLRGLETLPPLERAAQPTESPRKAHEGPPSVQPAGPRYEPSPATAETEALLARSRRVGGPVSAPVSSEAQVSVKEPISRLTPKQRRLAKKKAYRLRQEAEALRRAPARNAEEAREQLRRAQEIEARIPKVEPPLERVSQPARPRSADTRPEVQVQDEAPLRPVEDEAKARAQVADAAGYQSHYMGNKREFLEQHNQRVADTLIAHPEIQKVWDLYSGGGTYGSSLAASAAMPNVREIAINEVSQMRRNRLVYAAKEGDAFMDEWRTNPLLVEVLAQIKPLLEQHDSSSPAAAALDVISGERQAKKKEKLTPRYKRLLAMAERLAASGPRVQAAFVGLRDVMFSGRKASLARLMANARIDARNFKRHYDDLSIKGVRVEFTSMDAVQQEAITAVQAGPPALVIADPPYHETASGVYSAGEANYRFKSPEFLAMNVAATKAMAPGNLVFYHNKATDQVAAELSGAFGGRVREIRWKRQKRGSAAPQPEIFGSYDGTREGRNAVPVVRAGGPAPGPQSQGKGPRVVGRPGTDARRQSDAGAAADDRGTRRRTRLRVAPEFYQRRPVESRQAMAERLSEEGREDQIRFAVADRYPRAGRVVDGRTVREEIPNQGSIASSFTDYEVLPGVREIRVSQMDQEYVESVRAKPLDARTKRLAAEISASGEINPLIVAVDKQGPYVLEGGHRYDALLSSGAESFPALVVLDLDDGPLSEEGREGEIRFAVQTDQGAAAVPQGDGTFSFDVPAQTQARVWYEGLVNRMERLVSHEKAAPVKAASPTDVEALLPGRAKDRVEKLGRRQDRILRDLAKAGGTLEELDEYLKVAHAPARNEAIREAEGEGWDVEENPGSGIATSEAKRRKAELDKGPKGAALRKAAASVYELRDERLDLLVSGGLLSAAERDGWLAKYGDTYVPMRTIRDPEETYIGKGAGYQVRGPESKAARGRTSETTDVTAQVFQQGQEAILRTEKAKIGQELLKLIRANPDASVWQELGSKAEIPDGMLESTFTVKEGGVERVMLLRDAAFARAMRELQQKHGLEALNKVQAVATFYKRLHTSWNLSFIAPNLVRDYLTAAVHLTSEQGKAFAVKTLNPFRVGGAFRGMLAAARDPDGTSGGEWGARAREFMAEGGRTAWVDVPLMRRRIAEMRRVMSDVNATPVRRLALWMGGMVKLLEQSSDAVENAVRLSTYVSAVEAGMSKGSAALLGKRVTVNFNQKGRWSSLLGTQYLFFNPGVQGTNRIAEVFANPKSRTTAAQISAGIFATGAAMSLLNYMLGGEDDDGEGYWTNTPFWERERNMVWLVPGTEGFQVKLPLPWGYNVLFNMGSNAVRVLVGDDSPAQSTAEIGGSAFAAFSPIAGEANLAQWVAPWYLDPWVQAEQNQTWYGAPIQPPANPFDRTPPPASQNYYATVSPAARGAAQFMSRLTGGNAVEGGLVEVSPEILEHWAGFLGGGAGREAVRGQNVASRLISGEDVPVGQIPVLRRFLGRASDRYVAEDFYENLSRIEIEQEKRAARLPFDRSVLRLRGAATSLQRRLKALRTRRDASKTPEERQTWEDRIKAEMRKLNRRMPA